MPLKIPELLISNNMIERKRFIKLLGVILDESISWKITLKQSKIKFYFKSILLYRAKQLLSTRSLKIIYFSYFHTYLNYTKIAWASTQKKQNKLRTINIKQKNCVRIVLNEDETH